MNVVFISQLYLGDFFQPGSLLLADRNTLSSFLSLVKNSSAGFENFPNGTAVVQHLTRLEDELGFMLDILQRLERIFGFVSKFDVLSLM